MRVIVCDSGPVIHLSEANCLDLLKNAGEIFSPKSVSLEIQSGVNICETLPEWLQVIDLSPTEEREAEAWSRIGGLHKGEVEAFVLAKAKRADWFLTDDATARWFASYLVLEVHGSLGVLVWNLAQGNLYKNEAEQILEKLARSSLWLSARILKEAQQAIRDMNV